MNDLEVNDLATGCGKKADDTLFVTGWLKEGNVLGRPVDIITNDDGSLFVSDDHAGKIYSVLWGVGVRNFCFFDKLTKCL